MKTTENYYTGISFSDTEKIKTVFYSGDLLLSNQNKVSNNDFLILVRNFFNNPKQNFFNDINSNIQKIVGLDNCRKVGSGFGDNSFHISYEFKKEFFNDIIQKLCLYFKYLEIDDIVSYYDTPKDKWILFKEIK